MVLVRWHEDIKIRRAIPHFLAGRGWMIFGNALISR